MEKNVETTILYWVYVGVYWDSWKENGSYYIKGCYRVYIYMYIISATCMSPQPCIPS